MLIYQGSSCSASFLVVLSRSSPCTPRSALSSTSLSRVRTSRGAYLPRSTTLIAAPNVNPQDFSTLHAFAFFHALSLSCSCSCVLVHVLFRDLSLSLPFNASSRRLSLASLSFPCALSLPFPRALSLVPFPSAPSSTVSLSLPRSLSAQLLQLSLNFTCGFAVRDDGIRWNPRSFSLAPPQRSPLQRSPPQRSLFLALSSALPYRAPSLARRLHLSVFSAFSSHPSSALSLPRSSSARSPPHLSPLQLCPPRRPLKRSLIVLPYRAPSSAQHLNLARSSSRSSSALSSSTPSSALLFNSLFLYSFLLSSLLFNSLLNSLFRAPLSRSLFRATSSSSALSSSTPSSSTPSSSTPSSSTLSLSPPQLPLQLSLQLSLFALARVTWRFGTTGPL